MAVMFEPTHLNHRQVCAEAQTSVPFLQAHGVPSLPMFLTHMYGALPSAHSGSSLSMAFRGFGLIRLL